MSTEVERGQNTVDALDVVCPNCGAGIGDRCWSLRVNLLRNDPKETLKPHQARLDWAWLKRYQEEQDGKTR